MLDYLTYDLINAHLKSYFPAQDIFVFDEKVSVDFHLDTYYIRAGGDREFPIFFTGGVSGIPMNVPDPRVPAHIELVLLLPPEWSFEGEQWRKSELFWPIEYIRSLGRFPHTHKTCIGFGHTLPEPKDSYLFSQGLVATLLLKSPYLGEEFQRIDYENGYIDVLMPVPLFRSEYEFKKEHGLNAFLQKMMDHDFPDVIDPKRAPIV